MFEGEKSEEHSKICVLKRGEELKSAILESSSLSIVRNRTATISIQFPFNVHSILCILCLSDSSSSQIL